MNIKGIFMAISLLLCVTVGMMAQKEGLRDVSVSNVDVAKNDGKIYISMDLSASDVRIGLRQEVILTPILMTETQRKELTSVSIAGKDRYYRHLRNGKRKSEDVIMYRKKDAGMIHYQTSVAYEDWMQNAELMLEDSRCGCLNKIISEKEQTLATLNYAPRIFKPVYLYEKLVMEQKDRKASGSAFIDFVVNSTVINSTYRNNQSELSKIYATIDTVRNNPDASITSVTVKGYASPEGSYRSNGQLAKGRTESLLAEIQKRFQFPADVIASDYEAEDWAGLRRHVSQSSLEHKDAILDIIDSDMEADAKELKIRKSYPDEYKYMLNEYYPSLRHSDYAVKYTVKAYTDVEEARRVMKERPGNLSLYEFTMVADSYDENSEEYYDTYNLMAMIYPDNETASLNAANTAMKRGDLVGARKFLDKAGNSAKADYARGVLEGIEGNYKEAAEYFNKAKKAGLQQADEMLEQINELTKQKEFINHNSNNLKS